MFCKYPEGRRTSSKTKRSTDVRDSIVEDIITVNFGNKGKKSQGFI